MGSPFLLAHGGGKPVADASTTVSFPEPGTYRVWVRTRDWVPTHADDPGQFKLRVNGVELAPVFGTRTGHVALAGWRNGRRSPAPMRRSSCDDLTGFDGRCDAIAFIKGFRRATARGWVRRWRRGARRCWANPRRPAQTETFDCVVVGGGMAGCGASLAAARSGRARGAHPRPPGAGRQCQPGNPRGHAGRDSQPDRGRNRHLQSGQPRSSGTIAADATPRWRCCRRKPT